MKSIVINLERRPDRKQKVIDSFTDKNFNEYEFFNAIDGKTLVGTQELYNLFSGNDFNWRKNTIGCALSHYTLWKNLINDSINLYCIFEDDIVLSDNFKQDLEKCKNFMLEHSEIDVLFLGYHMFKHLRDKYTNIYDGEESIKIIPYNNNLYIGGFFGYIISKNGANKLHSYILKNGIKHGIDYLIKIDKNLIVYEIQPSIVKSDWVDTLTSTVDSDIQKDLDVLKFENIYKIVEINNNKYKYYQGLDSFSNDIAYVGKLNIDSIAKIAENNRDCKAFNNLGFLKNKIENISPSPYINPEKDGLYVKFDLFEYVKINGIKYKYYKGLDSVGNDLKFVGKQELSQLSKLSEDYNFMAFNTLGFLKNKIDKIGKSPYIDSTNGLYVKVINVKMMCNWCSSKQLCNEWNHMTKGNFTWNNIEIKSDDNDIDYYVIINKPPVNEFFDPKKTIVFQMEPWCYSGNQNWGVKTWGEWAKPDNNVFFHVHSHDQYLNPAMWQLSTTYNQFKEEKIEKSKENTISSIVSSKYFDPGHIKRIDFLKFLEKNSIKVDIYCGDNIHKFKNNKGGLASDKKDLGIKPYKYYFMCENNPERNYITEKLWEPILTETLCFYWGCPNVTDYINPDAFVQLDMDNFEKSLKIIKESIENNLWEQRIEVIKAEKQKILDYYNVFPTIERIITKTNIIVKTKIEEFADLCDNLTPIVKYHEIPKLKTVSDKCAVLIDTRPLKHLEFLIRQVSRFLNDTWSMNIFTGNLNYEYVKNICSKVGNISVINLEIDKMSVNDYNNLLHREAFWNMINSEHILIFQTDSLLLNFGIEEYLIYDYVGAPWNKKYEVSPSNIGNGGLSLRKKSAMLKIIKDYKYTANNNTNLDLIPEDIFFSNGCSYLNLKLPNYTEAVKFSIENIYYEFPIGGHQFWNCAPDWKNMIIKSVKSFEFLNKRCVIGGCVRNCSKFLIKIFDNIEKIQLLFSQVEILIYYDNSTDNTLDMLNKLRKKFLNLNIIIGEKINDTRVINICNARNNILKHIIDKYSDFEYMIMMDCDDVCAKDINLEILSSSLRRKDWDALSFNRNDYYDTWALSVEPYIVSSWHWNNSIEVNKIMKEYITSILNNMDKNNLLEVYSAFNGFGIYRMEKIANCYYDSKFDINMFPQNLVDKNIEIFGRNQLNLSNLNDCEHRSFHTMMKTKNNARICISPYSIF